MSEDHFIADDAENEYFIAYYYYHKYIELR